MKLKRVQAIVAAVAHELTKLQREDLVGLLWDSRPVARYSRLGPTPWDEVHNAREAERWRKVLELAQDYAEDLGDSLACLR